MILRYLRRRRRGRGSAAGPGEVTEREVYQGLELLARPMREGGAWRVAGSIRRAGDDQGPSYDFVRADTMAERDEATRMSLLKARQLVDEQGERLLSRAEPGGESARERQP